MSLSSCSATRSRSTGSRRSLGPFQTGQPESRSASRPKTILTLRYRAPRSRCTTLLRPARKCYIASMTTTEDIEKAVEQLAPHELARFRAWFEAFDAREFDAAVERDAQA